MCYAKIGTTKKLLSGKVRKEGLEKLSLSGHIEGKRTRGKTGSNLLKAFV